MLGAAALYNQPDNAYLSRKTDCYREDAAMGSETNRNSTEPWFWFDYRKPSLTSCTGSLSRSTLFSCYFSFAKFPSLTGSEKRFYFRFILLNEGGLAFLFL